jgi:hypothetical protein
VATAAATSFSVRSRSASETATPLTAAAYRLRAATSTTSSAIFPCTSKKEKGGITVGNPGRVSPKDWRLIDWFEPEASTPTCGRKTERASCAANRR